jgi:hypothetical protein
MSPTPTHIVSVGCITTFHDCQVTNPGYALSMSKRLMSIYAICMSDGGHMSLYAYGVSCPLMSGDATSMSERLMLVYIPYLSDIQSASLYGHRNTLIQYLTPPVSYSFHPPSFLLIYLVVSSPSTHPCGRCRRLRLLLQQNCMRHHDFTISCRALMDPLSWRGCCHLIRGEITSSSLVELYSQGFRLPSKLSLGLCIVVSRLCFLTYKPREHTKFITSSQCSMDNIEDIGGLYCMSHQKLRGGG